MRNKRYVVSYIGTRRSKCQPGSFGLTAVGCEQAVGARQLVEEVRQKAYSYSSVGSYLLYPEQCFAHTDYQSCRVSRVFILYRAKLRHVLQRCVQCGAFERCPLPAARCPAPQMDPLTGTEWLFMGGASGLSKSCYFAHPCCSSRHHLPRFSYSAGCWLL
jgi:hypothetical protein